MKHLNNDLLCVVTGFMTGRDYLKDDLIQICVVPVNRDFEISATVPLFEAKMKPRRMGVDAEYTNSSKLNSMKNIVNMGNDPFDVLDAFDRWFETHKKKDNKRLTAIAYDWPLLSSFIRDWVGSETFNEYFNHEYRDIISTSIYCNDRAYWHGEDLPYPKQKLSYMASQLKVDYNASYDIMREARATAQIYKKLLKEYISL